MNRRRFHADHLVAYFLEKAHEGRSDVRVMSGDKPVMPIVGLLSGSGGR